MVMTSYAKTLQTLNLTQPQPSSLICDVRSDHPNANSLVFVILVYFVFMRHHPNIARKVVRIPKNMVWYWFSQIWYFLSEFGIFSVNLVFVQNIWYTIKIISTSR